MRNQHMDIVRPSHLAPPECGAVQPRAVGSIEREMAELESRVSEMQRAVSRLLERIEPVLSRDVEPAKDVDQYDPSPPCSLAVSLSNVNHVLQMLLIDTERAIERVQL